MEYSITKESVKLTLNELGSKCVNLHCQSEDIQVSTTPGTPSRTPTEEYRCAICDTYWASQLTPVKIDNVIFPTGTHIDHRLLSQTLDDLNPPKLKDAVKELLEVMSKPSLKDRAEVLARLMALVAEKPVARPPLFDTPPEENQEPPF